MAVDVKEGGDANALELENQRGVAACLPMLEKSVEVKTDKGTQAVNLLVPERQQEFAAYVHMASETGQELEFPKTGEVVITAKLAENGHIKVGDKITFTDSDLHEMTATVSSICENYFNHYIIASPETYEDLFGEQSEWNMVSVIMEENADAHEVSAELMQLSDVTNVSVCEDIRQNVADMMASLNYVVVLVIGCAAALAFIVIYNLNNINITERVREIATIKVLGFYKEETKSYIFRENVVLTLLGSLVGIILGHYLHAFIMSAINLDAISFDVNVRPTSYLLSVVGTVLFNQLVNLFMTRKLENIHMAESLKSVD
jgi:putative ABC transport system permease protein